MQYPGRVIRIGERDGEVVRAIKERLNDALGLGKVETERLDPQDPHFGQKMKHAVSCFQARNVDLEGHPLRQDGMVGALTWSALFGEGAVLPGPGPASDLLGHVVEVAAGEVAKNVREVPRNSNRGPEVERYLAAVGAAPGCSWCCAFVYWCFDQAAHDLGRSNPMVRTAGCLDHWRRVPSVGAPRIAASAAMDEPALVRPGMVFIMDHGGGLGHTGIVERATGGLLVTIEGNTDASKTREGGGVYRLTRRLSEINKGFIDYAGL